MTKLGACFPFIKKHQKGNIEVTLAILGLDNAGKTATTKRLQGEAIEDVTPTVGFEKLEFSIDKYNINLYDLGGGKSIRDIWKNYFSEVYGVIYVVDSTDVKRLGECKNVIHELLSHSKIQEKPILLLANKQDQKNALDEAEILEELQVGPLVNEYRCPCRLELCSAAFKQGRKLDPAIKSGMRWLLAYIGKNLDTLAERVSADMDVDRNEQEEERAKRRERVKQLREERDRDRRRRGEVSEEDTPDDGMIMGNPFKKLDKKQLEEKEKASKDKKRDSKMGSSISRPFDSKSNHRSNDSNSRSSSPISSFRRKDDEFSSGSRPFKSSGSRVDFEDQPIATKRRTKPLDDRHLSNGDEDNRRFGRETSLSRNPFITDTSDSADRGPNRRLDPLYGDRAVSAKSANSRKKRSDYDEEEVEEKPVKSNKKKPLKKNKLAPEERDDYDSSYGRSSYGQRSANSSRVQSSTHRNLFMTENIVGLDDYSDDSR